MPQPRALAHALTSLLAALRARRHVGGGGQGVPRLPRQRASLWRAGFAAITLLSVGAVPAWAQQQGTERNARLEAPPVARPGDRVAVAVEGFTPGTEVLVFLMGPGPSARLLRTVEGTPVSDASGNGRWQVRIPDDVGPDLVRLEGWWLSADDLNGRYANRPVVMAIPTSPTAGSERTLVPTPLSAPAATLTSASLSTRARVLDPPRTASPWVLVSAAQLAPTVAVAATSTAAPAPIPTSTPAAVLPTPSPPPALPPRAPDQRPALTPTAASATPRPLTSDRPLVSGTWAIVQEPGVPASSSAERTFTTSVSLRLRSGPSVDSSLVGNIPAGATLRLLANRPVATEGGDFYQVQLASGTRGYVAPDPDDVPAAPSTASGTSAGSVIRLRLAPNSTSPTRVLVPLGTRARILDMVPSRFGPREGQDWALVRIEHPTAGPVEGYLVADGLRPE